MIYLSEMSPSLTSLLNILGPPPALLTVVYYAYFKFVRKCGGKIHIFDEIKLFDGLFEFIYFFGITNISGGGDKS